MLITFNISDDQPICVNAAEVRVLMPYVVEGEAYTAIRFDKEQQVVVKGDMLTVRDELNEALRKR